MAERPKRLKHEDRIKALEDMAKFNIAMRESFMRDIKSLALEIYELKTRRWWQFWK